MGGLGVLLEMLVIFPEMLCSQDLYLTSPESVDMPPKKQKLNEVEAPVAKCTTQHRSTRVHFAYNTNSDINLMKNFSFWTWMQENTSNHILTLSFDLVLARVTRFVQVHFLS